MMDWQASRVCTSQTLLVSDCYGMEKKTSELEDENNLRSRMQDLH